MSQQLKGSATPSLDERAWTLIRKIAVNCKGCPFHGTHRCETCECQTAAALSAEKDRARAEARAFGGRAGSTRAEVIKRRSEALSLITNLFVRGSDIKYAPWEDRKTRANDLRALANAGLIEVKPINGRDYMYRRAERADASIA